MKKALHRVNRIRKEKIVLRELTIICAALFVLAAISMITLPAITLTSDYDIIAGDSDIVGEDTDIVSESELSSFEQTLQASDGNNYTVSVSCGPDAGIPEGAGLEVRELFPAGEDGTDSSAAYGLHYEDYVAGTEDALGWREGTSSYARVFDISIVMDGEKLQPLPGKTVDVKVELSDSEHESLSVVHFEEGRDEGIVVDNSTETAGEGQAVLDLKW